MAMNQDAHPLEISENNSLSSHYTRGKSMQHAETLSPPSSSSSVWGPIFNFTNSIIGAGAIGLGGAFALSGGFVSIASILFFAFINKRSLDMIISLVTEINAQDVSYESLGTIAYGTPGRVAVMLSKTLYSFGGLIAYLIVIKDNFGSALVHLIYGDILDNINIMDSAVMLTESAASSNMDKDWFYNIILNDNVVTVILSTVVMLPLCLLRDMTPLSKFSVASILAMAFIVVIVIYLKVVISGSETENTHTYNFYNDWVEVKYGIFQSLGTFVFTFVCQNTVFLAYNSIDSDIRNLKNWKRVSFWSIFISSIVSLTVGLVVYVTFWEDAPSDIFEKYPSSVAVDCAKLLLSTTMLLTFPFPFFTCREMVIVMVSDIYSYMFSTQSLEDNSTTGDLEVPFLSKDDTEETIETDSLSSKSISWVEVGMNTPHDVVNGKYFFLMPGDDRQLIPSFHVLVTGVLWAMSTILAIVAPSLGDILDLVGSATGSAIAFILPALFSFKIIGFTYEAAIILVIGCIVGSVGTFFSVLKLVDDF